MMDTSSMKSSFTFSRSAMTMPSVEILFTTTFFPTYLGRNNGYPSSHVTISVQGLSPPTVPPPHHRPDHQAGVTNLAPWTDPNAPSARGVSSKDPGSSTISRSLNFALA